MSFWFTPQTDRSLDYFCRFGEFFALLRPLQPGKSKFWDNEKSARRYHFTHMYHKWKLYDIWCAIGRIFSGFGPIFALIPLRKSRKTTWDIIILYKCNINGNYMMHGSWDVKRERQNFLSIWVISCPFTPLTTQKIKILKKWKKHLEISSLYTSVPKIMIIRYTVL